MQKIDLAKARKIFGEALRSKRESANETIDEVAARAGLAPSRIIQIEGGELNFHLLTLLKLSRGYQVGADKLLECLAIANYK